MFKFAIAPLKYVVAGVFGLLVMFTAISGNAAIISSKLPNDIVLVLDNSGSMRKNDKNVVTKQVATQFIRDAAPNSHIGILIFDTNVKFAFRLAPATGASRDALLASLDNLDFRGRWTNMPAALSQAMAELATNGRDSATKAIVLLTDGVVETGNAERDREDSMTLRRALANDAAAHGVKIFTVALGPKADTELLQVMANQTFADYYWVAAGDDLPPVFDRIHGTISRDTRLPAAVAKVTAAAANEQPKVTLPAAGQIVPAVVGEASPESKPAAPEQRAPSTPAVVKKDRLQQTRQSGPPEPIATTERGAPAGSNAANWSWTVGGLLLLVGLLLGLLLRNNNQPAAPAPMTLQAERNNPVPPSRPNSGHRAPQAFLQDISGVTGRPRHELDNAVTVIGRLAPHPDDPFGHLVIDQPTIGRRHAVIERRQHGFWVSDQHSKNGTYVNEQRVTDEVSLAHGDRLRFHEYEFEFFLAGWGLVDETVSVSDLRLVSSKRPDAKA